MENRWKELQRENSQFTSTEAAVSLASTSQGQFFEKYAASNEINNKNANATTMAGLYIEYLIKEYTITINRHLHALFEI